MILLRFLLVSLACLSLACAVIPAQAQQVQLGWDAPLQINGTPVPNVAGYKLYYGSQSGQYQTTVPVGMTTMYTVTHLAAGQTYYFAVQAYDALGTEGALSNEVSVTLPTSLSLLSSGTIPPQQMQVVSVDSQELVGENGAATNAIDGNPSTFWHTEWYLRTAPLPHTLVLDVGGQYQVDGVRYLPRQDGSPNGTIADYQFYVSPDGVTWGPAVAAGTFAADTSEQTVRFTAKTGRYVRLVALSEMNGNSWTSAAELSIYGTAVLFPSVTFSASPATLTAGQASTVTWSSTNATSCTASWTAATPTAGAQSVTPTATTTYTMTCTGAGGTQSASTTVTVTTPVGSLIPQQQMQVVSVDSQDLVGGNGAATNAIDGNPSTFWHTEWYLRTAPLPHTLVLDVGGQYQIDGVRYLPRQDGNPNGTIAGYQFYVSPDGVTWGTAVVAGTFAADTSEKTVWFTAKTGRYVRLVALSEMNGNSWTSAAALSIYGLAAPSPLTTSSVMSSSLTSTAAASQSNAQTASAAVPSVQSSSPTMTGGQNTRWEMTLTSTQTYANPFTDVTVSVEYTKAGAPSLQGYGFWDGGSTFKLRQAFPEPGTWHYKTTATNQPDGGLHNRQGDVQVLPYTGTNALYRHGFLQVSTDQRFLAHADGTPFLWIGDTLWGATVRLTEAGFHDAVADRRAKHFTVLQTNFARKNEVDPAGDTPWNGDRWNVRFMQKLDRMFDDANDQGMYLFVNGLVDLLWDRGITPYERLIEMIGARYTGHYVSFASSMDDPYDPIHEQINRAIQRTAPRSLVTQHPGAARNGQGNVWTAEQYYDTSFVDYVVDTADAEEDLALACHHAIEWSLHLYNHVPPKPIVNGMWYEDVGGRTAEMTMQLGYLSLLSGNFGYTYGTRLWNARDADLPAWKAFRGATYMQYLYDFFVALDGGRPLQPRQTLIKNQPEPYQHQMALGVSADGMTYAAFLPNGGRIHIDLQALAGTTIGVTWYNPLTGQYLDVGTIAGGAVRSFASPFDTNQSALVLMAQ